MRVRHTVRRAAGAKTRGVTSARVTQHHTLHKDPHYAHHGANERMRMRHERPDHLGGYHE